MISDENNIDCSFNYATQSESLCIEKAESRLTLAIAKPDNPCSDNTIFTPQTIKKLVDQNIKIFMQFGFGNHNPYSDSDYANAGVEFVEKFADLVHLSKIVMKFDAFTEEQVALMRQNQIIFSVLQPSKPTIEYIEEINSRKISALALDFALSDDGSSYVDKIRAESLSDAGFQIAISNFLQPIAEILVHAPNMSYAIQRSMVVMQSFFCHQGTLCSPKIAEQLQLPWRDILSLCWNLN